MSTNTGARDTPAAPTTTRTELDALWDELLLDACASDGPIRDNDVRQAIKHYRAEIEAEARSTPAEALDRQAILDACFRAGVHLVRFRDGDDEDGSWHRNGREEDDLLSALSPHNREADHE